MTVRAHIASDLRDSGEIESEAAILVTPDKVIVAASEAEAFKLWLALTAYLAESLKPSRQWQALHVALAHGRAAELADAQAQAQPDYTSASTVLDLVKEIAGPDVYAKVRQGTVDRMLGRSGS
jgi:hypothetical protein